MLVIGGFAGVRPAEIRRLRWENIWGRESSVEVEPHQAKKRRRRLIERLTALESWLEPYRLKTGLIWEKSEGGYNKRYRKLRESLGINIDGKNLLDIPFVI
jgi:integrase